MIWRRRWEDPPTVIDELRAEILRREKLAPSHASHNVGGWRSSDDLLDSPLDAIAFLRTRITQAVVEVHQPLVPFVLKAWAIVNRAGSHHKRHIHGSEPLWSGIYYVDPGGAPSARTLFELNDETIYVEPEPGLMVLFPPMTWHSVEPHRGPGSRITIAFDVHRVVDRPRWHLG